MKHISLLILLITTLIIGCARTVTDRVVTLNFQATISLRENVDINNVNYLLIFSKVADPAITLPIINPSLDLYFPTPGTTFELEDPTFAETYAETGVTSFYEDYFDTWSDYILIHKGSPRLYESGNNGFSSTTTDNLTFDYNRSLDYTITASGKNIIINFDVSILESNLSETRYFTFATCQLTDDSETGYLIDSLDSPQSIVILVNNEESSDIEQVEEELNGASDIVGWRVQLL
jgi:hypothetical protein